MNLQWTEPNSDPILPKTAGLPTQQVPTFSPTGYIPFAVPGIGGGGGATANGNGIVNGTAAGTNGMVNGQNRMVNGTANEEER